MGTSTLNSTDSQQHIRDMEEQYYMKAMMVFCDLKSGKAFANNYVWPTIPRDSKTDVSAKEEIEKLKRRENAQRQRTKNKEKKKRIIHHISSNIQTSDYV